MPGGHSPDMAAPVTISVDGGQQGVAIPRDFAGLSFERRALSPGNAGATGYLFSPANGSLVTLLRSIGLRSMRLGGGSVDLQARVARIDNVGGRGRAAG